MSRAWVPFVVRLLTLVAVVAVLVLTVVYLV
jgi:hypothetical protein